MSFDAELVVLLGHSTFVYTKCLSFLSCIDSKCVNHCGDTFENELSMFDG